MVLFYLHLGPFSRKVSASIAKQIAQIDSGVWQTPPPAGPGTLDRDNFLKLIKERRVEDLLKV